MTAAVAMTVTFAAYALGLWGYCLLRGYNVTIKDIFDWNYPAKMSAPGAGTPGPAVQPSINVA